MTVLRKQHLLYLSFLKAIAVEGEEEVVETVEREGVVVEGYLLLLK